MDYRKTWPGFCLAQGAGSLSTRNSWDAGAVQVVISAGATRESHQDRASGAFGLHAGGDWLLSWGKVTTHSGIAQETVDSNCVSINGARQTWTQDAVTQDRREDAPEFTTLRADLTGAYVGQCSKYVRETFFLKTGTLFVRDSLEGVAGGASLNAASHAGRLLPVVDAIGYRVRGASAQLFAVGILPDLPVFTVVPLTEGRDPGVTGYRVDLNDRGTRQLLVAYQAAPLDQQSSSWREWKLTQFTGALSLQALVGWVQGAGPWSYIAPQTGRHYLLGLVPGTAYTVPGGTQTASVGGVLMFDGPAAGGRVTIQVADGGGGGGGDLTNRTFSVVSANLTGVVITGDKLTASGGQLVVQAIPGDAGEGKAKP